MIEQYWTDINVYSVEFIALLDFKTTRKFRKTLVFSSDIKKKDVFNLIPIYFNNIKEVLHVDEVTEGLFLKDCDK